jgi:hypothetical protein
MDEPKTKQSERQDGVSTAFTCFRAECVLLMAGLSMDDEELDHGSSLAEEREERCRESAQNMEQKKKKRPSYDSDLRRQ